jgi:hypothetical protein
MDITRAAAPMAVDDRPGVTQETSLHRATPIDSDARTALASPDDRVSRSGMGWLKLL